MIIPNTHRFQPTYIQPDMAPREREISIREVLLSMQRWRRYLLRRWPVLLLFTLTGAGLGYAYALFRKPLYVGELTFVLEENKNNPLSAYAGIASQFGIDLGGGASIGVFSGDNIIEFLRSRLMIETVLLSDVQAQGIKTSLADLYIDAYSLREKWEGKVRPEDMRFAGIVRPSDLSVMQDSVLKIIYKNINEHNLEVFKPDRKLTFINVVCTSLNPLFSKVFVERLVKEATDFYIDTKTKRSKTNVDKLQAKADSLLSLLNRQSVMAAASEDLNLNPARKAALVGVERHVRDKMLLQTMYGEVVKNLELSRMAMSQEMPVIQVVDTPSLPLDRIRFGKIKGLVLGVILGFGIAAGGLVLQEAYRKIMQQDGINGN